jgi:hypothetical protein
MRGNCEDTSVWGKNSPQYVVAHAFDCTQEAALTAVNFGLDCPDVSGSAELHALRAKCNGLIDDNVEPHIHRMTGHSASHIIVDSAWIFLTVAFFVRKLGAVFGPQTLISKTLISRQLAAAVSVIAITATLTPLRDGSCFRSYVDGSLQDNGDGASTVCYLYPNDYKNITSPNTLVLVHRVCA